MKIVLEVLGSPAPKGSARAMMIAGHARLVPSGSNVNRNRLRSWDTAVREAAREAVGSCTSPPFVGVPLRITIVFRLARPSGHWGKGGLRPSAPPYPITKPDVSKLVRATEDSLIGVVFDDDSRVVSLFVEKNYSTPGNEGATIVVEAAEA